ncbi:MAG: Rrf2 family transcriptional regulator [Fibrobacter sp.]|nr:Rrf2 family transcriptional regulator [Fibrobacter sp.]MDY6368336.1 Rrf2 family transcriptional regulator [Fibrobacter sp.]MDY6390717.1 Rrf2 family transcriptional regulator [Fibrobacter sp.]
MKISTKGRYGVRFLIDIAEQGPDTLTTLSEISLRQDISAAYLGQIAVSLKRAGFIRSIKGSSGGFVLAKLPSEIQLHDVLSTLEGDLTIVDPPSPSAEESLYRKAIRMGLYQKIDAAVLQTLGSLTLEKILSKKNLQNLF